MQHGNKAKAKRAQYQRDWLKAKITAAARRLLREERK